MFHSRIKAAPAPRLHSLACPCADCLEARDPIAYRRKARVVQWQAVALVSCLVAFYGVLAVNAPDVAAAFGIGL